MGRCPHGRCWVTLLGRPALQMRRRKPREVEPLAQGHKAEPGWSGSTKHHTFGRGSRPDCKYSLESVNSPALIFGWKKRVGGGIRDPGPAHPTCQALPGGLARTRTHTHAHAGKVRGGPDDLPANEGRARDPAARPSHRVQGPPWSPQDRDAPRRPPGGVRRERRVLSIHKSGLLPPLPPTSLRPSFPWLGRDHPGPVQEVDDPWERRRRLHTPRLPQRDLPAPRGLREGGRHQEL
jgi:hypothetical protein